MARRNFGDYASLLGMARDLRFLIRPYGLVELTLRTIQQRFLLRPSRQLNSLVVGVLARAQTMTKLRIHGVVIMSNHLHILASPATVEQMSRFMQHIATNLSKEVGRLHDWSGPLFARRYSSIPVSDEPEAQIARLRYLLSHGAKEDLVVSPRQWPGVHCATALSTGKPLHGIWIDRRTGGQRANQQPPTSPMQLVLEPLPCWAHCSSRVVQADIRSMVRDIETETKSRHRLSGTKVLGSKSIRALHPHHRPRTESRRPRPRFHTARSKTRSSLLERYRLFVSHYRSAARRLHVQAKSIAFPENCFPPRPAASLPLGIRPG